MLRAGRPVEAGRYVVRPAWLGSSTAIAVLAGAIDMATQAERERAPAHAALVGTIEADRAFATGGTGHYIRVWRPRRMDAG